MLQALSASLVSLSYPPYLSLALAVFAAVAWGLRWRWIASAGLVVAVLWTTIWSFPITANGLMRSLEHEGLSVPSDKPAHVDAIVVLGGGTGAPEWFDGGDVDAAALSSSRVATGARLWRQHHVPVILSGGPAQHATSEARIMATAMEQLGVPDTFLILEERSRNTRENARFVARLARERGVQAVFLVTSSMHMPRAALLFRRQGLEVDPIAVNESSRYRHETWLPTRSASRRSGRALKEWAGLLITKMNVQKHE